MSLNITPLGNSNTNTSITNFVLEDSSSDVLRLIYSYLSVQDLVHLGSTKPRLYTRIFSDSHLWTSLLEKYFPGLYVDPQLDAKGPIEVFKHLACVRPNMRAGRYQLRTLSGHQDFVITLLTHGSQLISSSNDNMIKIWDLASGKELHTFKGHKNWVHNILIHGEKLISASLDGDIKIWDIKNGKELHTIAAHRKWINRMFIHKDQLISASDDRTIKIWDIDTGNELKTLVGHLRGVRCISMYGENLISGSNDGEIKIWDLSSGATLQTIAGHQNEITALLMYGNKIVSASQDRTIKVWDLENGDQPQTLKIHRGPVKKILINEDLLISVSGRIMKTWDLKSGKELQTFKGHHGSINGILVYQNLLISASVDKTIKIWDLDSGEELQTLTGHQSDINTLLMYGDKLLSTSDDNTIKIWDFGSPSLQPSIQALEENQRPEPLQSILAELGMTVEECSVKLNWPCESLQNIGILSIADLKAIWGNQAPLPDIQHLQIAPEEVAKDRNQRQTLAFAKKDVLTKVLQDLLKAVNQRVKETENCSVLLYEAASPWTLLQEKLNNYQIALEQRSESPQMLLVTFEPENYAKIVEEVNALIDLLPAAEREHQVALLRAYASQWGILGAWKTLHPRINSLAALLEHPDLAPQDLFNMGK